ncbi:MAG: flavodoxin domain-containing protein [Anaerolineae bacterium]
MPEVLVAYATKSGSTAEVAEFVGAELRRSLGSVDVLPIESVEFVDRYDAVVVGAPMLGGWHTSARRFLSRHEAALSRMPVAYFVTALTLTLAPRPGVSRVVTFADPTLARPAKNPVRLSFKESHTSVAAYVDPILAQAPEVLPVGVGFFAGKLDYARLDPLTRLYVRLLFGTPAGDYRNWEAIRGWAKSLCPLLVPQTRVVAAVA